MLCSLVSNVKNNTMHIIKMKPVCNHVNWKKVIILIATAKYKCLSVTDAQTVKNETRELVCHRLKRSCGKVYYIRMYI